LGLKNGSAATADRRGSRWSEGERMHRLTSTLILVAAIGCGKKPLEKKSDNALEGMLADPNPTVQAQGAYGLSQHGHSAKNAIPALIRSLNSPDTLVRQQACVALGNMGADAEQAVPALVSALNDTEWVIRRQAAVSLGQIGTPLLTVEAPLQRCENDSNSLVRKAAREALLQLRNSKPLVHE
jgi:HEAT repeat protein